jgi:hypothetical protein
VVCTISDAAYKTRVNGIERHGGVKDAWTGNHGVGVLPTDVTRMTIQGLNQTAGTFSTVMVDSGGNGIALFEDDRSITFPAPGTSLSGVMLVHDTNGKLRQLSSLPQLLIASGDPAGGGGTVAPVGSLALRNVGNGPNSTLYVKTGAGDSDWNGLGGSSPGGADTNVQFNDGGVLAGAAGLSYNKTTHNLIVGNGTIGRITWLYGSSWIDGLGLEGSYGTVQISPTVATDQVFTSVVRGRYGGGTGNPLRLAPWNSFLQSVQVQPFSVLGSGVNYFDVLDYQGNFKFGIAETGQALGPGITGQATDGASAVGLILDNVNALSTAGSKLLSIRNATVEKASFRFDGTLTVPKVINTTFGSPLIIDYTGNINQYSVSFQSGGVEYGSIATTGGGSMYMPTYYAGAGFQGGYLNGTSITLGNGNAPTDIVTGYGGCTFKIDTRNNVFWKSGLIFDSYRDWIGHSASMFSFSNLGVEYLGLWPLAGGGAQFVSPVNLQLHATTTLELKGSYTSITNTAADDASGTQVAHTFNTPAYTTAGTKLLSIQNNSVEQAYVDTVGRYINTTGLYDDVQGPAAQAGGAAALTFEAYRDTAYNAYFFKHNQNDVLYLSWQMPHSWDRGTVYPHIHIIPMVNPAAAEVIRFSGKYVWSQAGVATPADASWTAFTADHTVNTTDQFIQVVVPLATVSAPTSPRESNVLLLWVQRESNSASDTYTTGKASGTAAANVMVVSIDAHFAKTKAGTITAIPTATP